jgi:nucleotide-binding universal stress UspA family protein
MPSPALPGHLTGALVVAVDDSEAARGALRFALELAAGLDRPLVVVSVWNFLNTSRPAGFGDGPPTMAAWQAEAERLLAELLAEHSPPAVELRQVVAHGNTTPVLLAVSERADHLIVGNRGRGGFTGLLLGSTSDQLVHHASCPVTVVRRGSTQGEAGE